MRKIIIFFLILLFSNRISSQGVLSITKKYFRYDPFKSSFGFFVKHLTDDPALKEKNIAKITDSTFYFFDGVYRSHSPFSFTSQKTKIILAEQPQPDDTSTYGKNIMVYQLVGHAAAGEEGKKSVQEEYRKFCRKYTNQFHKTKERAFGNKEKNTGEITDFAIEGVRFNPVTAAWSNSKDNAENLFVVTIRFIVVENTAYLPFLSSN